MVYDNNLHLLKSCLVVYDRSIHCIYSWLFGGMV